MSDVLKVVGDVTNWKKLGLALGLRYPTLTDIETYRLNRPSDCMMDMLSAWLQQKDNVCQKAIPSWSVLQDALQEIGEKELADSIVSRSLMWAVYIHM